MNDKIIYSGIYQIRNIINNKVYIGSSINLKRRRNVHFNDLLKNKHKNIKLQNAYNKYGKENFVFEILEIYIESKILSLLDIEQKYLDIMSPYKKNYNISNGSFGGDNISNNPNYEKICKKISKAKKQSDAGRGIKSNFYGDHRTWEEKYGEEKASEMKMYHSQIASGQNNKGYIKLESLKVQQIIELYLEGSSLRKISKLFNLHKNKISRTLKENHIRIRTVSEAKKGRKIKYLKKRSKIECPHCHKEVDSSNYARWHGDNCKQR